MPEIASGWAVKEAVTARRFMVAAANPLAADAGLAILDAGGSAIDAAIAVQMVLGLVEPQSSGIGGGAFLMHWDGAAVAAWDGRETAPAIAHPAWFLDSAGAAPPFAQAMLGGRAVATPGLVKMLEAAHRAHGVLPWAQLFASAIRLAEEGFLISPRLHTQLAAEQALRRDPLAGRYFYRADGQPHPVGHRLRNPALAAVMRSIANQGSTGFYAGPVAADLSARVLGHALPGGVSSADLAAYQPRQREPLCVNWLQHYRVCGMGPPSSGQLTLMQILGLLERSQEALSVAAFSAMQQPPQPPQPLRPSAAGPRPAASGSERLTPHWLHVYTEAARLAYADRASFIADPDFVPAPAGDWRSLLQDSYLRQRAALIGPRSMGMATAGQPGAIAIGSALDLPAAPALSLQRWSVAAGVPGVAGIWPFAPMPDQPEYGTSHISVVDAQGRAVAMTSTIEAAFGARLMADGGTGLAGGYLLNNQMTDFSLRPTDAQDRPVANQVQAGKRPRSSMSPTLVFDRREERDTREGRGGPDGNPGRLLMSLGSPGGPAIIHFTAKTLTASLQWGLDLQTAVALPNFGSFNGPTVLEEGRFPAATLQALQARGHTVREIELTSGLQGIQRTPEGWLGGADPRREGEVRGR